MTEETKSLNKSIKPKAIKECEVYNLINEIRSHPSEYTVLNQMFAEKVMLLSKCHSVKTNENLYGLSEYITHNFSLFSDFIHALRSQIIGKQFFEYEFGNCDEAKNQMILSLLNDFKTLGMIGDYTYNGDSKKVSGKFLKNRNFLSYISGGFFEDFAYCEAKKVLEDLSRAYGVDYELYRNVYVHTPVGNKFIETREIDLLIRFDNRIYIVEVKSGNRRQIRNFHTIGLRLGVEAFCSMLLIPKLKDVSL